jgi:hypothetical protein
VAPHKPTPGQTLGQGIDLVVVAAGEGQKFGHGILKPRCPLGSRTEPPLNRSHWVIRRESLSVSGAYLVTLIETLLKALDKALADGRFLEQERPRPVAYRGSI